MARDMSGVEESGAYESWRSLENVRGCPDKQEEKQDKQVGE